jgi:hypothetical protein
LQKKEGQTIQWSTEKRRTDNTMVNRKKKDRQYNGQQKKEGQTIQWSTEKRRHGGQFYWWRKPEYLEKTTDLHKSLTKFITH